MFQPIQAPYPQLGGKSRAAELVWQKFGKVHTYVEPFRGSQAVLLGSPYGPAEREITSDIDGFGTNAWLSIKFDFEQTAFWADFPTSHIYKIRRRQILQDAATSGQLREKIIRSQITDDGAFYYDPKIAGLWLQEVAEDISMGSKLLDRSFAGTGDYSANVMEWPEQRSYPLPPHVVDGGSGRGVSVQKRSIEMPKNYLADGLRLQPWFLPLANRTARVIYWCQDWETTVNNQSIASKSLAQRVVTGWFLDPPYVGSGSAKIYLHDDRNTAGKAFRWCIENGDIENYRIALCGYEDDYKSFPSGWVPEYWKRGSGLENIGHTTRDKSRREVIWFSPYCLHEKSEKASSQLGLL